MNDRRIEIFLATVKTGSFSKAASLTNCSQSAVTQSINKLEDEVNCKLVERNHNGITLTSVGEQLLPFFLETNTSLIRLMNQAKLLSQTKSVPIRIGSFSSIANQILPLLIKEFRLDHPDTVFEIRIGTDILSSWLMNNEIDLAFGDEHRLSGHSFHSLMSEPYYAVIPTTFLSSETKQITQSDFIKYPFIMAPMNDLKYHLQAQPTQNINVICDDDSSLVSMVANELGVTIMPGSTIKNIPENVSVLPLEPPITHELGFSFSKSITYDAKKFLDFLLTQKM